MHQFHRQRGEDAHAIKFAAIQQHLAEAHVVVGRGHQAAPAGFKGHVYGEVCAVKHFTGD